jgi:aminopeptidase N
MLKPFCSLFLTVWLLWVASTAQCQRVRPQFTHQDTLRGTITPERAWWDVLRYDISIQPDFLQQSIRGSNKITFAIIQGGIRTMQIDLQKPLVIDSAVSGGQQLRFARVDTNAWFVYFDKLPGRAEKSKGSGGDLVPTADLSIYYHGNPRIAKRPPWDGGWIFTRDKLGRPWMSVACQGLGASVWYPCKDHQSDEPDSGASLSIIVPDTLVAVGNGRLVDKRSAGNGLQTYVWRVVNPINNYDIIPYIGKYDHWTSVFHGEKGKLDCSFWVLDNNMDKARKQFAEADTMLRCFEFWFGPYPFYEDGYKLVEAPHLGMEHQSAVAYGNKFANGYLGSDLSGSGWGLHFDFIIVHESGHEWFGNNITTKDLADMWVHEGFANYSETLYVTCRFGVEAGNEYNIGSRRHIRNDKPIIAHYGVNEEGSGDMYYKGGSLLHMIRQIVRSDEKFRDILRGLNRVFYHQTVTSSQVEAYISSQAGMDLSKVFDQYLRTTQIPVLEYSVKDGKLNYRWTNCIPGFNMPVRVHFNKDLWLSPTESWQQISLPEGTENRFSVDPNFYVGSRES